MIINYKAELIVDDETVAETSGRFNTMVLSRLWAHAAEELNAGDHPNSMIGMSFTIEPDEEDDESEIEVEMEEGDYQLTPCGPLGGKTSVTQFGKSLDEFDETEQALEFVRGHMDENNFWPSIWWVSDHGNSWLIDLEGNEIK